MLMVAVSNAGLFVPGLQVNTLPVQPSCTWSAGVYTVLYRFTQAWRSAVRTASAPTRGSRLTVGASPAESVTWGAGPSWTFCAEARAVPPSDESRLEAAGATKGDRTNAAIARTARLRAVGRL